MHSRFKSLILLSILLGLSLFTSYQSKAQTSQDLRILSPGTNSVVTAPIQINASVSPGDGDLVRVILVDWQQNLLARQVLRVNSTGHSTVELLTDLLFEIPGESTRAMLTIATEDQARRPISIRSVPVILQSSGEARIEMPIEGQPWLLIKHPNPGAEISESPLIVVGTVEPTNDRPVIFELINKNGNTIVTRQLRVDQPGDLIDFEVVLPYLPNSTIQDLRLVIRQTSDLPGIDAVLDSVPIRIVP